MQNRQLDELFQILEKYELSLATLYETFAFALPETKDAWMVFANEERLHAKWMNQIYRLFKDGNVHLKSIKITPQSTQTAINYIEHQTEKISKEKPDLKKFLDIAIDIEKSLLETSFFKLLEFTDPQTKKTRDQLKEATDTHIEKLIDWRKKIVK